MKYMIAALAGAALVLVALLVFNSNNPKAEETAASSAAVAETHIDEAHASTVKLAVEGMTCQGCVGTIQGALTKTGGVLPGSVVVSLENNSAELKYDPAQVSEADLIDVIKKAGYSASLAANQ